MADEDYVLKRKEYIDVLKSSGRNPYPHSFQLTESISDEYDKLGNQESNVYAELSIAGRLLKRIKVKGIVLYDIDVGGENFRMVIDTSDKNLDDILSLFRDGKISLGDIVGITGYPGKSKHGDFLIFPKACEVLSYCLHLLPKVLEKKEHRYGKRFLDMIINPEVRGVFQTRAKVISFIRRFLDERGFLEVETSILNKVPGLGGAVPFVASHDKKQLYMRIAPELGLKQLVVGGLNRVYEIGKQFRCEDIDRTHHPEFTSCEFYIAYADYNYLMKLTEDLLSKMVKELTGGYTIQYKSSPNEEPVKIDFSPPFRRLNMVEELERELGISIPRSFDEETTNNILKEACKKNGVVCESSQRTTRLLDKLADRFIGEACINPTFILNHPQIMSPMAKYHRSEEGLTERFELFVNKSELINAYTELNDAVMQRENFDRLKEELGNPNLELDDTFLTALEYGLPPTAGWGIGIDRLVMLLTNSTNIRDVIFFPLSKKAKSSGSKGSG